MPRKGQAYIQAPVTDETFTEYNTHRKELKQTWLEYLLGALAQYKASHPVPVEPPVELPAQSPEAEAPSEGPPSEPPEAEVAKNRNPRKRKPVVAKDSR